MIKKIADKMNRKKGQTAVEYILIVGVIVGVIMLFGSKFRDNMKGITDQLFGSISSGISNVSNGQ